MKQQKTCNGTHNHRDDYRCNLPAISMLIRSIGAGAVWSSAGGSWWWLGVPGAHWCWTVAGGGRRRCHL